MNRHDRPALALTLLALAGSTGLAGTAAAQSATQAATQSVTRAATRSADAPPSRPGNFRASLYAGAGGELFWQRSTDDRGVRGYEVTKNGQSLGIRDALSYYDPSLRSDTPYTFTVVAIDFAGQRSAVATTTLGGVTAPPNPPQGTGPAAPRDMRLQVYSSTAAELFWTRAPAADRVVRTEVRRDGARLGSTPGNSFFDDTRTAGRTYRYELTAVSASGARSSTMAFPADEAPPAVPEGGPAGRSLDGKFQRLLALTEDRLGPAVERLNAGYTEGTLAAPIASCVDPAAGFPVLSYPLSTDFTSGSCVGDDSAPRRTSLAPLGFPARAVRYVDSPACRDGLVERGSADDCDIDVVVFRSASGYWTSLSSVADPDDEFSPNIRATRDEAAFFRRLGPPPNRPGTPPPIDPSSVAGCTARFSSNDGATTLRPTDDSTESRCNEVLDALIVDLGGR